MRFTFVDGHTEAVTYLGRNKQGMYRFLFPGTGEIWTGYTAPVTEE